MLVYNNEQIPITNFPNGESVLGKYFFSKYKQRDKNILVLKYESDADLLQLLLVRKALWFPCELHISYFPYSRMDRHSDEYVFTLKSIAKLVNWLDFAKVVIYEPHSDVTPALLNHCTIRELTVPLLQHTDIDLSKDCVYYPDTSAYKRYSHKVHSENEIFGVKQRDFLTGKITNLSIFGDIPTGSRVWMVDDLCSKGRTFTTAAKKLKEEHGVKEVNLVVGHCENTIFDGEILETDLIDHVYTTNSLIDSNRAIEYKKITLFPFTNLDTK